MPRLLAAIAIMAVFLAASMPVAQAQTPPTTPTVSTVAVTSDPGTDNTYAAGNKIEVTLTFSEAVTASTTDGTPRLSIDIGGQPRNIPYERAGTNTGELIFCYTVFAGDMDADGIGVEANGLALNGGTIQSTDDSTDANLVHSAQAFANHKVDTEVVLVSNIGQTDASDTITISATESATTTFRVPTTNNHHDLTGIVLDVKTASETLDVTINVSRSGEQINLNRQAQNFTFAGPVATVGRQVFTLEDPYHRRADVEFGEAGFTILSYIDFAISISGSGEGTVEIGVTTSSAEDTGGQSGFVIHDPATGGTIPRFSLVGHTAAVPFIYQLDLISKPADGMAYKAGERIEVRAVLSSTPAYATLPTTTDPGYIPVPLEAEFWFGNGAEHRRAAQLIAHWAIGGLSSLIYGYEVKPGDTDSDGILLGVNALGRNVNFNFVDDHSGVPFDLSIPALQQAADQRVQGSQTQACQEIWCASMTIEETDDEYTSVIYIDGAYIGAIRAENPALIDSDRATSIQPFETKGSLSQNTFMYGGADFAFFVIASLEGEAFAVPHWMVQLMFSYSVFPRRFLNSPSTDLSSLSATGRLL